MMAIVAIVFLQLLVFQQGHCREICRSAACAEEASSMQEAMDKTIDPCDDFFEFACRGWLTKNPLRRGQHTLDRMDVMGEFVRSNIHDILDVPDKKGDGRPIKLARAMYRSCMDMAAFEKVGMTPLYDALKKLELPRTVPNDDEARRLDLGKIAGLAHRYYGVDVFIKPEIRQNPSDTTTNLLLFTQPTFIFEGLQEVLLTDRLRFVKDAMANYIKQMLKLTGAGSESDDYTTEFLDVLTKISQVLKGSNPGAESVGQGTIDRMQRIVDRSRRNLNMETYMLNLFTETGIIPRKNRDTVVILGTNYYKGLSKILQETAPEVLGRAAWISVLLKIGPQSTQAGRDLYAKFRRYVYTKVKTEPKWYECTKLTDEHFNIAITAAYIEKFFTEAERKKAKEMWNDVRSSFDDMLNELQWMDSGTKSEAHQKLHAMAPFIAYPDWMMDPRKVKKYYEEYDVHEGKLYESTARAKAIEIGKELATWKQTADRSKWIESFTKVNAFYSPTMNSVTIPVGILHIPFFGSGVDALNYGAIGAVLGHELTHGFDNDGRKFDANGNYRNWWSRDTLQHYLQKVQCMIKQYSGYEVTQLGRGYRVDGVLTQGENIADNGGLTEAFRAYKKLRDRSKPQEGLPGLVKYTDEQLFFLGFAQSWCGHDSNGFLKSILKTDEHAPNRYRVLGTLQNSDEFAKAYNCPRGSRMNPRNKCIVW